MGNAGWRSSGSGNGDGRASESRLEAAAGGDLPMLRLAFSGLSAASSHSSAASIPAASLTNCLNACAAHLSSNLHLLASQVGAALADAVFESNKGDLKWIGFLKGFERCCRQGFHYMRAKLANVASTMQDQSFNQVCDGFHSQNQAETGIIPSEGRKSLGLLSSSITWAISISQNDTIISSKLAMISYAQDDSFVDLLYRSSVHGMGMNRFWVRVEGYKGPVFMLMSGSLQPENGSQNSISNGQGWIVGALLKEGFENKDSYYGSPGSCLYALDPIFLPLRCTGGGSNYVYTHTSFGSTYQAQPRSNGIAFGGDYGKERLFLDEDFTWLTVRHHAVDKTYQSGMLLPSQGFAPMRSMLSEVEVWGLGGKAASNLQEAFRKREDLFSEQKRKVELKSFGNWADSPEKMMMNMVADPNKIEREER